MRKKPQKHLAAIRAAIDKGRESLSEAFIKKPEVDAIVMDLAAESMARRGIELKL